MILLKKKNFFETKAHYIANKRTIKVPKKPIFIHITQNMLAKKMHFCQIVS